MPYKLTMIFQATTTPNGTSAIPRTAGWTESVYNGTLTTGTRTQFAALMAARAGLLPNNAAIIGQRYQVVLPTGGSSTGALRFPGTAPLAGTFQGDIPSSSLLCKTQTAGANIRNTIIRCLPDNWISGGELVGNTTITAALQAYFDELTGWDMLGRDLTAVATPITEISEDGVVSFYDPLAIPTPCKVRIASSIDADGFRRGGSFKALSQPTTSSVLLLNWPYGVTENGTIRIQATDLRTITTTSVARVITKKVGRPLFVFRGRKSKTQRR